MGIEFREPPEESLTYRLKQFVELKEFLDSAMDKAGERRESYFHLPTDDMGAYEEASKAYRTELAGIVGFPPAFVKPVTTDLQVRGTVREKVGGGPDIRISRMQIPVAEGLTAYGLLLEPAWLPEDESAPLMLMFHGGGGSPEMVCGLDHTDNYHAAGRVVAGMGCRVFAPLFTFPCFADGPDRGGMTGETEGRYRLDARAKWLGGSLAGLELYKVARSLDYFLSAGLADPDRIGVAGLSYGGFHALLLGALDTRISFTITSCMFNDRRRMHGETCQWPEMMFPGALPRFTDPELAALVCPRYLCVEVGARDELLPSDWAVATAPEAARWYASLGISDRFLFDDFDGVHEFNLEKSLAKLKEVWKL